MSAIDNSTLIWLLGIALAIISYFLKAAMDKLKEVESNARDNSNRITALEIRIDTLKDRINKIEKRIDG